MSDKKPVKFAISRDIPRLDRITVPIVDPRDGTPTPVSLTLASPYSPQAKSAQYAIVEALRAKDSIGAAEFAEKALDALVACTVGWQGVTDEDGAEVLPTADLVRALYDAEPWIYEQAQAAYNEKSRFFAPRTTA
jgi:hypothetical protein